ncbi:LysR family transcriptional regulator [Amorphus orientalis]|uniref:DNA-binding transcriptional LysR family regulator n=1 Tax=Amorphus orientalis TaxID=649198 RepID=A0AAE3VPS3_9HYPH|nr:LysR family transcriptional regulator [Amorphus orientalis]MDQ0315798.1 DNA-binding transcriptional LysR family regulator [Amorphus orientalis]
MEWIQTLRSFTTAVQEGSLSGAGRLLGLSPASISRHISSLEDRLETQLLKRSSRHLALTEAGEIYYARVEQVLAQLEEANHSVSQLQAKPQGVLRVHSRMLVGQLMILPHLPEFLSIYPDITVDLMMSNSIAPVMDQGTDVDIRIGRLEDSSLIARKLTSSERVVCASPGYLAERPAIAEPADLRHHNCLTYRINLGTPVWRFLDAADRIEEVPIRGNVRTDFGFALVTMVRDGVGIGLLPDWSVHEDLKSGRLVRLLPDYKVSHIDFDNGVYAVFPATRQTSVKLRLFIDFIAGVFKRELDPAG